MHELVQISCLKLFHLKNAPLNTYYKRYFIEKDEDEDY